MLFQFAIKIESNEAHFFIVSTQTDFIQFFFQPNYVEYIEKVFFHDFLGREKSIFICYPKKNVSLQKYSFFQFFSLSLYPKKIQLIMAASVYATPPPDHLSGDETALSDVSETVPMSPTNTMKPLKRTLSVASLLSTTEANANDSDTHSAPAIERTSPYTGNESVTEAGSIESDNDNPMDAMATGDMNNDQLSAFLMDSMPDNSKKRRKQSMPFRISEALNAAAALNAAQIEQKRAKIHANEDDDDQTMPRIFLSNLSQLQEKLSPLMGAEDLKEYPTENGSNNKKLPTNPEELFKALTNGLTCGQCGLRLDSEIQLRLHMLQEHASTKLADNLSKSLEEEIPKIFVKKDLNALSLVQPWNNDDDMVKRAMNQTNGAMKPEDWLASLSNQLPFAFPPEAAMMLSASGYLPQMPLLGVGNPFQSADGIPRATAPPLRIFNPEAYCELCNKEFCNKYFLKTHKANKHSIYESMSATGPSASGSATTSAVTPSTAAETASANQLSQLSQIFQMQQQQLAAAQQLIAPKSPVQSSSQCQSPSNGSQQSDRSTGAAAAGESSVLCDVCFKRYPTMGAMRRHRSKAHEIPPSSSEAAQSESNKTTSNDQITMPDGFREDYQIEQEDVKFTPQPRKMSPQSMQLAREANFSVDKLKRLGVVNPEAFCEICCKEYCNKYFLRTHKIKRHGIFMPMDDGMVKDERSMVSAAAAAASAWQLMQNAPLNLIMNHQEALNQLQNQRKKFEAADLRKMSVDSMNDDEPEQQSASKKRKITDGGKRTMKTENGADDIDDQPMEKMAVDANDSGEHISVDLQKLQTMIMQLSDLNAHRPVACGLCGKELDNQFALHSHMLSEHSNLIGDNNNGHKPSPPTSPIRSQQSSAEQCKHCDKELPNQYALTQHMFDVHGIPPTSPIREGFVTPERPVTGPINLPPQQPASMNAQQNRPYTITPTSSYCEICNKELCNKYFMKTHMQRMHGIEIENGAQIGGVVCNICNKELCSKYFLRVHKHNSHGIVDDGAPPPNAQRTTNGGDSNEANDSMYGTPTLTKSNELNYAGQLGEVCPLCSRRFRGAKWLRSHLLSDHGKVGAEKLREIEQQLPMMPKSTASSPTLKIPNGTFANVADPNFLQKQALTSLFGSSGGDDGGAQVAGSVKAKEYQCTYCSFSTPSYAFLYIHKRSLHAAQLTAEALSGNDVADMAMNVADNQRQHSLASDGQASNATTPRSTPATTPVSLSMAGLDAKDNDIDVLSSKVTDATKDGHRARNNDEQRGGYAQNVLMEMANMTKRPTTYAIPQDIGGGMVMQSFLMQPIDDPDDDASSEADDSLSRSRFVPSVVFLPVKERIVGKTTISFSLTPA